MAQVGAPPLKVIKPHFASTRLAFAESGSGGGSSTRSPDAAKPPTTATTPPRAREEAAAEALRSLMAEQQLSQTDLLRGLALL